MSKYVEFPLEDGGTILIESPEDVSKSQAGFVKGGAPQDEAQPARQSLDESVEGVRKAANLLVTKLRSLGEPPDEMEVRFNLKASGELGSLAICRGGTDANFGVLLKWKREVKPPKAEGEKSPDAEKPSEEKS